MEKVSTTECSRRLLPVKDTLEILNGKWKLLIIVSLHFGDRRFKELQRETEGITAKVLSKELKDLEMNGLIKRSVYDTIPVSVVYSLTEYGKSLDKVIAALHEWGSNHRQRIMDPSDKKTWEMEKEACVKFGLRKEEKTEA